MIILDVLLFSVYVICAPLPQTMGATQPSLIKTIKTLPFYNANQLAQITKHFQTGHDIAFKLDKSVKEALQYHNAELDYHGAIRHILEIPKTKRYKYLIHLLKNPSVDLSIGDHNLARTLVAEGDMESISVLLNSPKIDLSFDDNHLIKIASADQNFNMINLLLHDERVRKSSHRYSLDDFDDELESLGFPKPERPRSDSEIAVSGEYGVFDKSLEWKIERKGDAASLKSSPNEESHPGREAPLRASFSSDDSRPLSASNMSDMDSLTLSSGVHSMRKEDDYDWIDNDVDWEYIGSDDDLSMK